MKLPHHVAGAALALALAACSGAQNGATPMTVPNGGAGGGTHYSVPAQHQAGVGNAATTALIVVANEGGGTGGTISEFSESANGNVAPSSVITNHNNGPVAIAFSSKEGIGFANGGITSGGQFGVETFSLAGDFLTGIEGFAKHTGTNAVAFDSKGQLFVSASFRGRPRHRRLRARNQQLGQRRPSQAEAHDLRRGRPGHRQQQPSLRRE